MRESRHNTVCFNAETMKALLFNELISSELGTRLALSPLEVKRWVNLTMEHLEELFQEDTAVGAFTQHERNDMHQLLSPGEIVALLEDRESPA